MMGMCRIDKSIALDWRFGLYFWQGMGKAFLGF